MVSKLVDDMLRAQAEAVYQRRVSDEEWAARREFRTQRFDVQLAVAIAKVALENIVQLVQMKNKYSMPPNLPYWEDGLSIANAIRDIIAEIEQEAK